MENKTENKFGNFLNFMKKFLAMSFFCAIAAFGFGASNTWADASTTPESNFVSDADAPLDITGTGITINKIDDVYYKIESNNTEAVKMADENKANATIYGNFNYKTSSTDDTGTPTSLTAIDAGLLNGKLKNLTIENYPEGGITVNGTVAQGEELDTLTAVSSDGNKVAAAKNDSELLKLVGNDSNKINPNEETPPTAGDTNTEGSGSTSGTGTGDGETNTSGTDNGGSTGNGDTATGDSGSNTSGTDNGGTGNGDTATGSNGNNGTNTSGTDNGGAGNGGTATGDSETNTSGTDNGGNGSNSGNGTSAENGETGTSDNLTPANVTSTKLEYESGKTTWGKLLEKAKINTSEIEGASGAWKVTAGSTSGTIIDYKTNKGDLALTPIMESGLESVTFNYEHGENDKFSDSGNIVISLKDISEDVDKEKFGDKEPVGNHVFYVNKDSGETSAIISSEKDEITWLRESSDGTAAWYGFNNNSSGKAALPDGSIVSVNWINKEENPDEFERKVLEATNGKDLKSLNLSVEDNNIWLFELNAYKKVQGADGKVAWEKVEKSDFKDKMEVYIEIGDDWDINDIDALWLDNQEQLSAPEIVTEKIDGDGVEKRFAVLKLDHFSNYLIYDKKTVKDIIEKLQNIGYEEKLKYAKDHPEASEEELNKIAEQAVADAYNNLSKEDREQLDNFLTATDQSQNQDTVPDADKNDSTSNSSSSSSSGSSKTSSSSGSSWSSSSNDSSWSSGSSSSSNYGNSSYTASSGTKTGKNENLSALLFLLSTSSILSLNSIKRKKYFN